MKIGTTTYCFYDRTWEEACKAVSAAGLEAIEVGAGAFAGKVHCNPEYLLKDRDAMIKFKKAAENEDLIISAFACHGNPLHPQKKIAEEHIKDLENSIELASKIGVEVVGCLAGCPGGGEDAKYPNWVTCPWPTYFEEMVTWQWKEKVIPFWKEMAKKAKKAKIKLGFEMHPGDVVYNTETLLKLREEVSAEEISCNFDPAHLLWQGMDPVTCIEYLGNMIVNVHAKDNKLNKKIIDFRGVNDWKNYKEIKKRAWTFRTVGYGHGLEFWNDLISALRLIGYNDVITIEHEDPLITETEGLNKAIDFLKRIILKETPKEMYWV